MLNAESASGEGWVVVIADREMSVEGRPVEQRRRWRNVLAVALMGSAAAWACSKEATPGAEPQNAVARPGVETPSAAAATAPRPEPSAELASSVAPAAPADSAEALAGTNKVS